MNPSAIRLSGPIQAKAVLIVVVVTTMYPLSAKQQTRITIFAFVMLSLFLVSGLVFLVLTFAFRSNADNLVRTSVVGRPDLVFPGPGDPLARAEGRIQFHLTHPFIEWEIFHTAGSVLSLDILGPVRPDEPRDGPVKLVLCRAGTPAPCLFTGPNTLVQRITASTTGEMLSNVVADITDNLHQYKLRINSTAFPDGSLACRLG